MKMSKAVEIMHGRPIVPGFLVTFEHAGDGFLRSDSFPDVHAGEPPIETEEEAWALAALFAAKTHKRCVNVYVIQRDGFGPVENYRARMIENR